LNGELSPAAGTSLHLQLHRLPRLDRCLGGWTMRPVAQGIAGEVNFPSQVNIQCLPAGRDGASTQGSEQQCSSHRQDNDGITGALKGRLKRRFVPQ